MARRRATYADILALPEHQVGEIIDGDLVVSPRPGPPHALASSRLANELIGPFDRGRGGPGGWIILFEPELHLGSDVLVPDLAGWRRERLPELPKTAYFEVAPDWICEILSPSTEAVDRARKLRVYARERVAHVWLIKPEHRTLEVLAFDGSAFRIEAIHQGEDPVRAVPFDAVELPLSSLWGR
jgi:Uma2 family endonuclease